MKKTLLLSIILVFGLLTTVHSQGCGDVFTDPAGPTANYANNVDYTVTIYPTNPGDVVTVTFTAFQTELNFDALYVFNGNSIAAPQIASNYGAGNIPGGLAGGYGGNTIPGPFTSTSPDGSLTFRFRSDNTVGLPGWIANITCSPPPTCLRPTALTAPTVTHNSVTLTWTESNAATEWECIALPQGIPAPTDSVTGYVTATSNPFSYVGLISNTCYTFYVRAVCSPTDKSAWSVGRNACTLVAPPVCGGNFVDAGGPTANYPANSNSTTTICPTNPGEIVTVTFTSFNTEANWDALYVFDGNSTSASQIASSNPAGNNPSTLPGGYWGATIPGPFIATNPSGCLTFNFRSDGSVQNPGWIANVTCGPPPSCPQPFGLSATTTTITANLSWTGNSSATQWEVIVLPVGSPAPLPTSVGTTTSTIPFVASGLLSNTCYSFYVRGLCSETDKSAWTGPYNFCTQIAPPVCGGTFVDNGGTSANYSNNSDTTYTICPTNPGEIVSVVFNTFDTETNWDALYVFDGNSVSSPQISSGNPAANVPGGITGGFWGTTIPGPFLSTSPDGCLTFRFRSDGTTSRAGWNASVNCIADADKIVLVAFVDSNSNGVRDASEATFPNGTFQYQINNDGTDIHGYSPTGQFAIYDSNPANSYSFSYEVQAGYAPYYTASTTTYSNITIPVGSGSQILYFPVILTQHYNDVTISIDPTTAPRPGFTYMNRITYRNYGFAPASGTITFTKPSQVTTVTSTQAGINTNVSGFTYDYTNLLPNETRVFYVTMTVPTVPVVNINELLTDTATITGGGNDINPDNNSSSNSQIVVNSWDPNDKMESRGKTIPFNTFAPDDYFFYTIRFQNDGTANAIDVRLEDLLNAKIDETSVIMVSSSHNYTMRRIGNQLVWNFKNIFLAPSSLNENASRGFVQFKVKLKPGFQAGDIIPNRASIYFDSNPAIVTAIFNSKFIVPLSVSSFDESSLVLYPNPASTVVQIGLVDTDEQINKIIFYDILGKVVKTVSTAATENVSVDVADLSKGVYLVEITSESNLKVTKKLILN